jgi:hypothetical protein
MKTVVLKRPAQKPKHNPRLHLLNMQKKAIVWHIFCYLSSTFDNRAGNLTDIEAVHRQLFRTLQVPYF